MGCFSKFFEIHFETCQILKNISILLHIQAKGMFFFGKSLHDILNKVPLGGVRQLDTKGRIIERYSYKKGLSLYQEADF